MFAEEEDARFKLAGLLEMCTLNFQENYKHSIAAWRRASSP